MDDQLLSMLIGYSERMKKAEKDFMEDKHKQNEKKAQEYKHQQNLALHKRIIRGGEIT